MTGEARRLRWQIERTPAEVGFGLAVRSKGFEQRTRAARRRTPAALRWTLLLFVLAIPFEALDIGFGSLLSPARVAGLPFFLVCVLAPKRSFRAPSAAVWCFLAYLGVVAVASLYTPPTWQGSATAALATMMQLVLFFWIASNLFRDHALVVQAMQGYAVASVVLALGVLAGLPGFSESLKTKETHAALRVTAFDYNPNNLAAMASVGALVLAGSFLQTARIRNRLFLGAAAVPLVLLIVRTGSRSGVLAFLAGFALFLIPTGPSRRRLGVAALAGVCLLGAVYLVITDPLMQARLSATYEEGDAVRDHIYTAALQAISERPIVGWGPGYGLRELGRRLNNPAGVRDAHNLIFYLLLEVGILGAVPFLLGLWIVARAAWRGRRGRLAMVPLALVVTVLAANVTHTFIARKPMWLALAIGLASAPSEVNRRRIGNVKARRAIGQGVRSA